MIRQRKMAKKLQKRQNFTKIPPPLRVKMAQKLQPNQKNQQSSQEKPNSNSLPKSYLSYSHTTAILFSMPRVWLHYAYNSVSPSSHLCVISDTSNEDLRNTKGIPKEDRKGSLDLLLAFLFYLLSFVETHAAA